jgi:hypothetical protein
MIYHYVVGYNTKTNKWFVEYDTGAYFPEGHVWDDNQYEEELWGWGVPTPGTPEDAVDNELVYMLESLVDTWPTPKEGSQ